MIYLRLHQARSEEIESGATREYRYRREKILLLQRNFAIIANFCYVVNFATCRKFRYIVNFRYNNEISLCKEIPPVAKFPVPCFCVQTTPFLVNFISTLTVIILVRLDLYFHLFVRLYKPFSEHFVTKL